jgi:hypothetical protein
MHACRPLLYPHLYEKAMAISQEAYKCSQQTDSAEHSIPYSYEHISLPMKYFYIFSLPIGLVFHKE